MKKFLQYISIIVFVVLAVTSCITPRTVNYMQEPRNGIAAYPDSFDYADYRLKAGDYLMFQVYSLNQTVTTIFGRNITNIQNEGAQADLYTYKIEDNGYIKFPVLDSVLLAGKTVRESNRFLEEELRVRFPNIKNDIAVTTTITRRYFSVIGEGKTGRYTMPKEKISIYEALAMMGDLGIYSNRSDVKLIREMHDGTTVIKQFDLRSRDIINSEFYYIEPNDVIYIKNLREEIFGITTFPMLLSTILTTYSFGFMIYTLVTK